MDYDLGKERWYQFEASWNLMTTLYNLGIKSIDPDTLNEDDAYYYFAAFRRGFMKRKRKLKRKAERDRSITAITAGS